MALFITLFNVAKPEKRMEMEHRFFGFRACTCGPRMADPACVAYNVELEYEPLCRALGFSKNLPLFMGESPRISIPVVYPPNEGAGDPFTPRVPVVYIPVHKCTARAVSMVQEDR